jgi:molybdopterin converting factor small subunit
MIQITLKPHATLKEVFRQDSMIISVPDDITVREVLERAIGRFREELVPRCGLQGAHDLLGHCILLLNGRHHSNPDALEMKVEEGDQVEILVPLAGG